MTDPLASKLGQPRDVLAAVSILTRWPMSIDHDWVAERGAQVVWAFPVVGALLGLTAGVAADILSWIGVPPGMCVVAALAVLVLSTGALHEDGLADTADGLGPAVAQEKRFEIMADSRIGAFGATALVLAFLARWNGYVCFEGWELTGALIATGALSRGMVVLAMFAMPPAKQDGLSARLGQPIANTVLLGIGLALLISLWMLGWWFFAVAMATVIGALPVMLLANNRLGGQTGDILGAVQINSEIAALAIASAAMT